MYSALRKDGNRYIYTVCPTGSYCKTGIPVSECDLIGMATTKRTVWANFQADGSARWYGSAEIATYQAQIVKTITYVAIAVPVEIEE